VGGDGHHVPRAEELRQYYYHSDHLGSAQLITNYAGEEYERLEYTPYGELWIEKAAEASVLDIVYRFTGKERDEETGNYYYGARYLDPRTSRWLSTDPAIGEYIPVAPVNDRARKHNGNLPGMGGVFNYVNFHMYHYAGNNPVKYVDPDGRLFLLDDMIGAAIGNEFGWRDDGFWEGTWNNFVNTWGFAFYQGITPGVWLEGAVSVIWAGILSPFGIGAIGFLTPVINTTVGYIAIEGFGGEVNPLTSWTWRDALTISIQTGKMEHRSVCLGSVILGGYNLYEGGNSTFQLPHEQGHYFQSIVLGPLYWFIIGIPSFIATMQGKAEGFYTEVWANKWKR
jgi:RHS repeat-associated protein